MRQAQLRLGWSAIRERHGGHSARWYRAVSLSALLVLICCLALLKWDRLFQPSMERSYDPPEAVTGVPLPGKVACLCIDRQGEISVSDGEQLSLQVSSRAELLAAVSDIVEASPERPFCLKIDRSTLYEKVNLVLSVLHEAGAGTIYFQSIPASG
jgi:biopolymer transport protein ExbD